jgi:hypothetical protein
MSPRAPRWVSASPKEIATRRAVMARGAGLRRISSVTRWLAVGVIGLSGALALVASNAFHGRTVSNASASTPATIAPVTPSSGGLSPAAVTPTVTPSAPVVVSGGS